MAIQINKDKCTGCSYCMISCPENAISLNIDKRVAPVIDKKQCTQCGECIYVCPNNVFSSDKISLQNVDLKKSYDFIIIGAGIGGLMTAAGLAKAGKSVLVLEQLSFVGGKYTHLTYKGFITSTAAWTCPGPNSRIGTLAKKLGADIDWITIHDIGSPGDHWVVTKAGDRYKSLDDTQEILVGGKEGMAHVFKWIADMFNPRRIPPADMTARQYIESYFPGNETYVKYVETIITHCFASQTVDNFSAYELKKAIVDSIEQMADWGTAEGGTAAIVSGIEKVVRDNGGEIVLRTKVDEIIVENNNARGVVLSDGRVIKGGAVIHNAGLNRFLELVGKENLPGDFTNKLQEAIPAVVAALVIGTNKPLLGDDHSLLHTMGFDRTFNCYAPTFFDAALAPEGKSILDVFWVMEPPYDYQNELEIANKMLREIFPDIEQAAEVKIPMFFSGMWTAELAHRIGQSGDERFDPITPVNNLFMVGYDCIGYGIAGDIIPHGVEKLLFALLDDDTYKPHDEQYVSKIKKWIKSRIFLVLSLLKRIQAK